MDPNKPSNLIEEYEFNFNYKNEEIQVDINTSNSTIEDVQKNTRNLVRRLLVLTQSLEPLPENAFITMRLYYYDHTPIDYEPPMFTSGPDFKCEGQVLEIGTMNTEFHEYDYSNQG